MFIHVLIFQTAIFKFVFLFTLIQPNSGSENYDILLFLITITILILCRINVVLGQKNKQTQKKNFLGQHPPKEWDNILTQ